jgi:hypothetical protein
VSELPERRRDDLLRPYEHPYRHWLPRLWQQREIRRSVLITDVLLAATVVLAATGNRNLAWLAGIAAALWIVLLVQLLARAAAHVRTVVRTWHEPGELDRVRARRPHAGEADPELAHDEFAVTAEDSGELWIWRLRPLGIDDATPDDGSVLVPGRPRWAAKVVEHRPFDARDTGRAAEQLVEAQHRAAALEVEAQGAAHRRIAELGTRAELDAEARSTAGGGGGGGGFFYFFFLPY